MKGLSESVDVICFPSAEFKNQEFEKDNDIASFLDDKFQINEKETPNLTILSRSNIRKDPVNPIWTWLLERSNSKDIKTRWNFSTVFIVDQDGSRVDRYDDVEFDKIEEAVHERIRSSAKM